MKPTGARARAHLPYRNNAGVVLFNPKGKVFVGRRVEKPDQKIVQGWQLPQGGIEAREDPYDAARRELAEETNITSTQIIAPAEDWLAYDFPDEMVNRRLGRKYRGQRQMWYAMLFTGDKSEIDIEAPGDGAHRPEFSSWRWEKLSSLPDLVVPFKRDVYRQLVSWFGDLPAQIRRGEIPIESRRPQVRPKGKPSRKKPGGKKSRSNRS